MTEQQITAILTMVSLFIAAVSAWIVAGSYQAGIVVFAFGIFLCCLADFYAKTLR